MSLPVAIALGLALLAFGGFIVLSLGLLGQGKALFRSAMAFRDEVAPTVAEITTAQAEAQTKAASIQDRLTRLQETAEKLKRPRSRWRR